MSGYIGTVPVPQATQTREAFTASANQTSFATIGYEPGFLDVFLNGVKLAAADYTATNAINVVLATGAAVNDILEIVAYKTFNVANTLAPNGSAANLTNLPAAQLTGALPAISGAALTSLTSANLTGALPAIDGSALTGLGGGTPAGAVIYHAANAPPTGFIKANGAAISRSTYADLFSAIGTTFGAGDGSTTFLVPDLRGEFMRGWDDSRGIDGSRGFGSAQADAIKDHEHRVFRASVHGSSNTGQNDLYRGFGYNDFGTGSVANSGRSGPMFANGGTETRSRNIALLTCIKY